MTSRGPPDRTREAARLTPRRVSPVWVDIVFYVTGVGEGHSMTLIPALASTRVKN